MSGAGEKSLSPIPLEVASQASSIGPVEEDVQREESRLQYESIDLSVDLQYEPNMVAEQELTRRRPDEELARVV
eukprot:4295892-Karenia_brevis.AAC.1